jgi:hypothetical protein
MKNTTFLGTAAILLILGVSAVGAQSLKIRERMAAEETTLKESVVSTNKTCETSMTVQFDWKGAPEDKLIERSASSVCDEALAGIRHVCESPIGKEAVKQKIKSVTCGFGPARAITLKDGNVDFKIDFSAANDADYVYEFLQNTL